MVITAFTNYTPIADGQTGTAVASTLNTALLTVYGTIKYDFTQADGENGGADSSIYVIHGKNTRNVTAELYDSSWRKQNITGLFVIEGLNDWRLYWSDGVTLEETFHLIVTYNP